MTNTKTKIVLASLLAVGFASSAFASDSFTYPNNSFNNQPVVQQQRAASGDQSFAQAYSQPATTQRNVGVTAAESHEFNRVDFDTISSR